MGLRVILQKQAINEGGYSCGLRWAQAPAFSAAFDSFKPSPPPFLPPLHLVPQLGFSFPIFDFFGGPMQLMAVPKRKTSPHKRGIRNGPKALKPHPVIVRCKSCGRVKLQHYFCCSGMKEHTAEHEK